MDEKKRIKSALKAVGKKHIDLLREAFGDKLTISWFSWEKEQLGRRTPLQAIEAGELKSVKNLIEYLYDLSTLPKVEEVEVDSSDFAEDDGIEAADD